MSALAVEPRARSEGRVAINGHAVLPTPVSCLDIQDLEAFVRKYAKTALERKGAWLETMEAIDHMVSFLMVEVVVASKTYDREKSNSWPNYAGWIVNKRVNTWLTRHAWEVGIHFEDTKKRDIPFSACSPDSAEDHREAFWEQVADHRDHYRTLDESLSPSELEVICGNLSEQSSWTLRELMLPYAEGVASKSELGRRHGLTRDQVDKMWKKCVAEVELRRGEGDEMNLAALMSEAA